MTSMRRGVPYHDGFRALVATALLLAAACDVPEPATPAPPSVNPRPRPDLPVVAEPAPISETVREYYHRVQETMLAQGLMRQDLGGPDAPFNERHLVENFVQVALYDEYTRVDGRLVARPTPSRLRRWEQPVRMRVIFGDSIPLEQRRKDSSDVAEYAERLSRVSGVPIRQTEEQANFHVLILNEDERMGFGPQLRALVPGIDELTVRTVTNLPQSTYCVLFAFSRGGSSTYAQAVAVIRGEHPDLLRLSCIHEELAHGMGLANDSSLARPSVFNDDEEFSLLTTHDELMLQMLYDPRLRPGMTETEARPILQVIARELMGGES